jgi:hypothetical protein
LVHMTILDAQLAIAESVLSKGPGA